MSILVVFIGTIVIVGILVAGIILLAVNKS